MAISTLQAQGQMASANPNIISKTYTGGQNDTSTIAPPPKTPTPEPALPGMAEATDVAQGAGEQMYGSGFVQGQENNRAQMMGELGNYDRMLNEVYQGKSMFPATPGYVDNPADMTAGIAQMAGMTGNQIGQTAGSIDTAERSYQMAINSVLDRFNQFASLQLEREKLNGGGTGGFDIGGIISALTGSTTENQISPASTPQNDLGPINVASITPSNVPTTTTSNLMASAIPLSSNIKTANVIPGLPMKNNLLTPSVGSQPNIVTTPAPTTTGQGFNLPATLAQLPTTQQFLNPGAGNVQTNPQSSKLLKALSYAKNEQQVNMIIKLNELVQQAQGTGSTSLTDTQMTSANQLRNQFDQERAIADTMVDAHQIIMNSTPTMAGDQAAVTAFIRMLTKRSIVTGAQSEETAQTESLLQAAQQQLHKIIGGGKLLPVQRTQIRAETERIYQEQMSRFQNRVQYYASIAPRYGVDPYLVVGSQETLSPYFGKADQGATGVPSGGRPGIDSFIQEKPSLWETIVGGMKGGMS